MKGLLCARQRDKPSWKKLLRGFSVFLLTNWQGECCFFFFFWSSVCIGCEGAPKETHPTTSHLLKEVISRAKVRAERGQGISNLSCFLGNTSPAGHYVQLKISNAKSFKWEKLISNQFKTVLNFTFWLVLKYFHTALPLEQTCSRAGQLIGFSDYEYLKKKNLWDFF